jgi:hypothetical protein
MRWIKRKYKLKDKLKQKRTIKRFLLFPQTLQHETRWLEVAEIEQSVLNRGRSYKWKSIKFN